MPSGVTIKGDKQTIAKLRALAKKAAEINRTAVESSHGPTLSAVKAAVPDLHGDLREALDVKVFQKGGVAGWVIGAQESFVGADGRKPSDYDHDVEYGHVAPDGTHVPAQPYLRSGWEATKADAKAAHEKQLAAGIERAV